MVSQLFRLHKEFVSSGRIKIVEGYSKKSDQLGYDKFEQRVYMKYGNGAETQYTYDTKRRLSNLNVLAANKTVMDNQYTYDGVDNVLKVRNNAPANTMVGQMEHNYRI